MPAIEARYQENGFELIVYRERRPDAQVSCPECGRPVYHVVTVLDAWTESVSSIVHYHYCRHDDVMVQRMIRTDEPGQRTTIFEQPPHELLVELLATARQQNGRNVTQMTINRRWWAPGRYPLSVGAELDGNAAEIDVSAGLDPDNDDVVLPIPRYEPVQPKRANPFTSRKTGNEVPDEPVEEVSPVSSANDITDDRIVPSASPLSGDDTTPSSEDPTDD